MASDASERIFLIVFIVILFLATIGILILFRTTLKSWFETSPPPTAISPCEFDFSDPLCTSREFNRYCAKNGIDGRPLNPSQVVKNRCTDFCKTENLGCEYMPTCGLLHPDTVATCVSCDNYATGDLTGCTPEDIAVLCLSGVSKSAQCEDYCRTQVPYSCAWIELGPTELMNYICPKFFNCYTIPDEMVTMDISRWSF